jgi:(4S)-4-hydroxy-5-phosphonooxypentane-2,3-dione isomerase
MLAVTVHFRIKPEHREDFRTAVLMQATNSLTNEPRCRQFDVCFDGERPDEVFLFEVYDDEEAFAAHRQQPYFAKFGATVADWVAAKELHTWSVVRPDVSK